MERVKPTSSCHLTKYQQSGTKINMFLISVEVIERNFFFLFCTGADIYVMGKGIYQIQLFVNMFLQF